MDTSVGKRAQSVRRTRSTIRRTAMGLFLERGFDAVTTTEIAEAAGVSPATLFNHFATKEDLFFGQIDELEQALVGVVSSCRPGESILGALRDHVLFELTAGRSESDPEAVGPFHREVAASGNLQAREHEMYDQREVVLTRALAAALGPDADPLQARVGARMYVAAEKLVASELRDQLERVGPAALDAIVPFIDDVFDTLVDGLGRLPCGVAAAR